MKISVILCTHNPKNEYLERTLRALAGQTLSQDDWSLVFVDNGSSSPVRPPEDNWGIKNFVFLRDPKLGKSNAMVTAGKHLAGEWAVTVDDDNILSPDYLQNLLRLAERYPDLGVMSAAIEGEFEIPPPEWSKKYLSYLAIRPLSQCFWANLPAPHIGPIGAGMCVRRVIYDRFCSIATQEGYRHDLSRQGNNLAAGAEDTIFQTLAFERGYGCGAFPELRLTHLIPKRRLTLDYLKSIVQATAYAHTLLAIQNGTVSFGILHRAKARLKKWFPASGLHRNEKLLERARQDGIVKALCETAHRRR